MAQSFIGKPIALISHSDVRYRGTLAGIDAGASTIQLSNVYSMGTENRRPAAEFIPPVQDPYDYIIFRASEVKDLSVDEPVQTQRSVHDDPAVIGASAPTQQPYGYGAPPVQPRPPAPQSQVAPAPGQVYANGSAPQPNATPQNATSTPAATETPAHANTNAPRHNQQRRGNNPNSIHTATASLETVERALGDLRVSSNATHGNGRGGRRGGGRDHNKEIKVPNTDFDFQGNNAKFDKAAIAKVEGDSTPEVDSKADATEPKTPKTEPAYNPTTSFFDSLSSSTAGPVQGPRGGGRRGGAGGRNRREEERERNYATFGEPGGIGLMGPGQYVGGWGGYSRRSGGGAGVGRGRRGGVPSAAR